MNNQPQEPSSPTTVVTAPSASNTIIGCGSVTPTPASYHTPVAPVYRGNPLIHAIPKLPSLVGLIEKLECLPPWGKTDLEASKEDRKEMLESLKFFFYPLERHSHLAQSIFTMLRVGYVGRCPSWGKPSTIPATSAMESAALIGSSGTGKTNSIRRILNLIPQVILHTNFEGNATHTTQVAWLRVECPHDASPRALCTSFFEKLDEILGTDYTRSYGESRSTVNIMIPNVVKLVRQHHIGLLVIDEIQNLFRRKTNAANDLKDFIVRIINDLRVPVLMIGTAEASDFLDETFRVTRRTTGLLQPNWGRLAEDGREWIPFTDALWNYRYVLNESLLNCPVPGTDYNLRHLFFDLTQGIPDLAVKLYFLAQRQAINQGGEKVTAEVLKFISETSLSQNKIYLEDLRKGRKPKDDFISPKVFQDELALPGCPPKPKKQNQKLPKPSLTAPNPTLSLFDFKDGESMYEAGKRNALIHSDEG